MDDKIFRESNISIEVLNIVDAVILVLDQKGRIVLFNNASESMTGFKFEEIENKTPWDLFVPAEEVGNVKEVFSSLTAGNFPNKYSNYWLTKDKGKRLINWSNTVITDKRGNIVFIIATGIDVTDKKIAEDEISKHIATLESTVSKRTFELEQANLELRKLSRTDGLTNICNRRYFNELLKKEINRGKRSNKPLSLLICDVDFFKSYNDTYGHVVGDECLVNIATILKNGFTRTSDIVARYGGEEFIVLLPGTGSKEALAMANKLVIEIQNCKIAHKSSTISDVVTISAGLITRQSSELTNSTSLIEAADKALYRAKENGRNRVQIF